MLQLQLHSVNKLNRDALQIISDIVHYMQKVERNPKHIKLDDYVLLLVKEQGFPLCGFALIRKTRNRRFQLIHLIANSKKYTRLLQNAVAQLMSHTSNT